MKDLEDRFVREQPLDIGRLALARADLHNVRGSVSGRQLHDAEPIAVGVKAHGFSVDRHCAFVGGEVRKVTTVQADGHSGSKARNVGAQERTRTSTAFTAST